MGERLILSCGLPPQSWTHSCPCGTSDGLVCLNWDAVLLCLAVIIVGLAWVLTSTYLPRWLSPRLRRHDLYPGWRNVVVVAWTGLCGGVSLAAALALLMVIAGGKAFPERDLLIFLTFCVILATLVVQGLSLGPLIRLLQLKGDTTFKQEHAQAHLAVIQSAQTRLDERVRAGFLKTV